MGRTRPPTYYRSKTRDTAEMEIKRKPNLCNIILGFFFPALGGLLFGYIIGVTSGAAGPKHANDGEAQVYLQFGLDTFEQELFTSINLIGTLVGTVLAFVVGDKMGRRRELLLGSICFAGGVALSALAQSITVL